MDYNFEVSYINAFSFQNHLRVTSVQFTRSAFPPTASCTRAAVKTARSGYGRPPWARTTAYGSASIQMRIMWTRRRRRQSNRKLKFTLLYWYSLETVGEQ